jgi:hypothetical protein
MWVLGFAGAVLTAGCGKKGPPLAPIVHVPAAVEKVTAQRVGHDVYVSLTIPTQNIDTSTPADVARVDLFGVTAVAPPPRTRIFEIATKVGSIDVAPPPEPADSASRSAAANGPTAAVLPAQGTTVVVRDALTAEALAPKTLPPAPSGPRTPTPIAEPAATSAAPTLPRRFYVAVAVSDRGRIGPPGPVVELPLLPLPDPPGAPTYTYTEDAVTISWEPSGGVVGFLLDTPFAPEPPPVDEAAAPGGAAPASAVIPPGGPTLYNVYREFPVETPLPSPASSNVTPQAPINPAPVAALMFTDMDAIQLDRERCYTVRAVRGTAPNLLIGEPSPRTCVTVEDRFPPAAPTRLSAIASEGGITLIWEPNGEADLGGYVVLRARSGDATLQPITATPLTDNRYADRDVMPGVTYVYAVQAVDRHMPDPNVSDESNRVEETAR